MRLLGADALGGVRAQSILYGDLRSFVAWRVLERRVLARRLQSAGVVLCVLSLPCVFRGASLRRCYLLAQPCGSLRRPRRIRGDCDFPLNPPWILLLPLETPPLRWGLEAAGRRVLTRRSAVVADGFRVALSSYVAVRLSRCVLAPLVAAAAAVWLPPAAKEG